MAAPWATAGDAGDVPGAFGLWARLWVSFG